MTLPRGLAPMLATAGPLPADDGRWAAEVKWDGVRALAALEGGRTTLMSRNGNDVTAGYPDVPATAHTALLDGELVALSPAGTPDFGLLQSRMHVRRPAAELLARVPVTFVVFDLLHLEERSMLAETYDVRREVLASLELPYVLSQSFPEDLAAVAAATFAQDLEGLVVKRRNSRYEPGRRSECWVKVKHVRRQSAVVCGWKPGDGGRAGTVGSLLLGVQSPDGLVYAGHVGTGFTAATLALLDRALAPLARTTPPYDAVVPREHARSARWVDPVLVCDVGFTAWTRDGRLRHPAFKGLRDDLDPSEVVREWQA